MPNDYVLKSQPSLRLVVRTATLDPDRMVLLGFSAGLPLLLRCGVTLPGVPSAVKRFRPNLCR